LKHPTDVEEREEVGVAQKTDEVEDEDKDDEDNEDDDKKGNYASDYVPDEEVSEGTIDLADDTVAPDNPLDKVKPGQKVSSPFDLLILPIANTLLVKKGKKEKKVPDGDEESLLLLSNEEAPPLTKKKKELVTKLPTPGSNSKVGTTNSSEDILMMIKGVQEENFNLPWKNYVSVVVLLTFLFT